MGKTRKILITGKNSYIGNSFIRWIEKSEEPYVIDTVGTRNNEWKDVSFSDYDIVLHLAGIAHVKETKENRHLYYKVNRDLAYAIAKKAQESGVQQFVFMSSMSVYGLSNGVITKDTIPFPKSSYGKSKLEAEDLIKKLECQNFKIAIIRPPIVYGKNCKGNYEFLSIFAKKSPIFPDIKNIRSMIYIDNLSEYLKHIISEKLNGTHFPQNKEYVCTSNMVQDIAKVNNLNLKLTKIFNPIIKVFSKWPLIEKVFGNLYYEIDNVIDLDMMNYNDTIKGTES